MGQTLEAISGLAGGDNNADTKPEVQPTSIQEVMLHQTMRVTSWGNMQHLDMVWSKNDKALDDMCDVTFLPDEGVCVSVTEDNMVKRFDRDGDDVTEFRGTKVRPLVPAGIACSHSGTLLALCSNQYTMGVREFELDKPYRIHRSHEKLFMDSVSIAVAPSTGLWVVVEAGEQNCINIMRQNGTRVRHFGQKYFKSPAGVAVDAMDRIYVSDVHEHAIFVFTMEGTLLFQFGRHGDGDGELDVPQGLCIDPHNNVYVADKMNDRIAVFGADGTFKFHLKPDQQIKRPRAIALDQWTGRMAIITKDLDWPSCLYVFLLKEGLRGES